MRNEVDVVNAALQGSEEAFRWLVETYQRPVHTVVLASVCDTNQAQDLTQETFIRAYLNLEQLREPAKVGAWLCGIGRNVARKWLVRRKSAQSLEDYLEQNGTEIPTNVIPPDRAMQEQQEHDRLWQGIYSLPERHREVVLLFYMRGMKRREIADLLGVSEAAVRNRLHKARKQLKEELTMDQSSVDLPTGFTDRVVAEAMSQGEAYLQRKQWESAKEAFLRALDVRQGHAPAHRGIGLAMREQVTQQLVQTEEPFDEALLTEAIEQLSRAHRMGTCDWDTIWALAQLHEQFDRPAEAVELLWNHAQQTDSTHETFKARCEALRISNYKQTPSDEEILRRHRQTLVESVGKVSDRERFDTFWRTRDTYKRAGQIEEWLRESERIGLPIRDELWMHPWTVYTCDRSRTYAWDLDQKERAVEIAEEFLDYARNHPLPHPYRRVAMLDIYTMPLLSLYKHLGWSTKNTQWSEKLETAFTDIDVLLEDYSAEWQEMQQLVAAMSDATLREWDLLADHFDSGYGNELGPNTAYPVGGDREAVVQWLDTTYQSAIEIALHQIGCGFAWVGEGERAIACFLRKQNQDNAAHNMFLAEWMLMFRGDRDAALEYVRRAAQDRKAVARGYLKWRFFENGQFEEVRGNPEFVSVVNASLS